MSKEKLTKLEKIKLQKQKKATKIAKIEQVKLDKIENQKQRKAEKLEKKQAKLKVIKATVVKNADNNEKEPVKKTFAQRKIGKKGESKPKKSFRLLVREFPIKMSKEIQRIHWVGKGSLARSFLITALFVLAFALFFWGVQTLLFYLMNKASIIKGA